MIIFSITISGEGADNVATVAQAVLFSRPYLQEQFAGLNLNVKNLEETIMAQGQEFAEKIDRLTAEVEENRIFIQGLKDQISNLSALVEAGAADKEIADAARAALPKIDAAIAALDENTPAPAPTE